MDDGLADDDTDSKILQYMLDQAGLARSDVLSRMEGNGHGQKTLDPFLVEKGTKRTGERLEEPRDKKSRITE